MGKSLFFVGNWKMYTPYRESLVLYQKYRDVIVPLTQASGHSLIVCPPISALATIAQMKAEYISLAGQTCSAYSIGAYTGDTDALSLRELACTHCIIGHSERRRYHHETNTLVAQQAEQLIKHGIVPIVCVGETWDERQAHKTRAVVESQLLTVFAQLVQLDNAFTRIPYMMVAYEPAWAIGSGQTPSTHEVEEIFTVISELLGQFAQIPIKILYGGSVNPDTVLELVMVPSLQGFLIGKASVHVDSFAQLIRNLFK